MSTVELVQTLAELAQADPERFEQVKRDNPELWRVVENIPRELELVAKARIDSLDGFFAYYEGKYGFAPPHQVKHWVRQIYKAHAEGKGFTLNGYRGSWKTVSLSITFLEFRIGHEPRKTNLVIRASDITAKEITDKVTNTIEFSAWWKKVFPTIVPNKDAGWSGDGYSVRDTSVDYAEWVSLTSDTADPTLVGGGYTSQKVNGKHPTGVALTDDLHGINNSTSETERKTVVSFYTTEFTKTFVYKDKKLETWPINVGVPWGKGGKDDVHQAIGRSGAFVTEEYPVMRRAMEGEENAVYIDGVNEATGVTYKDIIGWWVLSNPENFDVDRIKKSRGVGKFDFWQMMMMDLQSAGEGGLIYYAYPEANFELTWPCVGGVDVPYDFKERGDNQSKLSSFAMAHLAKRPMGGAVLFGGVADHPTIGQAFNHILAAQSNFLNYIYTFCENVGGGAVFISSAKLMYPHMKIMGSDLGKIVKLPGEGSGKAKNKKTRIQTELAPWLENGTILILQKDDPYLNLVRDGLTNFADLPDQGADERLDALDAFYHAVKGIPEVLRGQKFSDELPGIFTQKPRTPFDGRLAIRRK